MSEIPKICKDCMFCGGKTGKYCTKYFTHLWNAEKLCIKDYEENEREINRYVEKQEHDTFEWTF